MRWRFCTVTPPFVGGASRHREERRSATGRGQGRAPLARRGDLMPFAIRPRQRHEIASAFAPTASGRMPRNDPWRGFSRKRPATGGSAAPNDRSGDVSKGLLVICLTVWLAAAVGFLPAGASAEEKVSKYDGMPQALVPAGDFIMGAEEPDAHGRRWEFPPHRVHLHAYWIDRHEVTNEQFAQFLNKRAQGNRNLIYGWIDLGNPCCRIQYDPESKQCVVAKGYEQHPACAVSWPGAQAYAQSVHRRLPTEAEWEKAARGSDGRRYPWGNTWEPKDTNTREGGASAPQPVGSCPADRSGYGAMDMAGNVSEWTADGWDEFYYTTAPTENPVNEQNTNARVVRGGGWCLTEWDARATCRQFLTPGIERRYMGFRCAETVPEPLPPPLKVGEGVLFYAPMDGVVYAAAARGERHPIQAPKEPSFVQGRHGQAVLLGDAGGERTWISYEAADNFRIEEGTVALWIQLRGWHGDQPGYRYFFMIMDEATCKFYLYRFQNKNLMVIAGNGIEGQWGATGLSTTGWKDGQWIHVAVTWKDRRVCLYVDGKPAGTTTVPAEKYFRGMPPSFALGHCTEWGKPMQAATAFDEFVMFSRALSPEEIVRERDRSGAP